MTARELVDYMGTFHIVDTHEHLPSESERLKQEVDFSTLFSHYCTSDLFAAGMSLDDLFAAGLTVEERWRVFEPYYHIIKNGSYARSARLAMEKFYGCSDLTSLDDAIAVSERMKEANKLGLYRKVLKDACGLRTSLVFGGTNVDTEFFTTVEYVTHLTDISSQNAIETLAAEFGRMPTTLSGYVECIGGFIRRKKEFGAKGLKFEYAYMRDLEFRNTPTCDAERVFSRIFEESQGWRSRVLGYEETRPLQDYLVHRIVEFAGDLGLPVVFHTGIHAANRNDPDNARPERLWSLVNGHLGTKFVLLHSGIPWVDEAAMLAKYFANVYLDMAWMHIISPEISVRALRSWVDLLPRSKVFGFGGDYSVVEKVYGHLTMAKQNIARALVAKTEEGAMTEDDARSWARSLLHDNSVAVYRLDGDRSS